MHSVSDPGTCVHGWGPGGWPLDCEDCAEEGRAWVERCTAARESYLHVRDIARPAGLMIFRSDVEGRVLYPLSYSYEGITPDMLCAVVVVGPGSVVYGPAPLGDVCAWLADRVRVGDR